MNDFEEATSLQSDAQISVLENQQWNTVVLNDAVNLQSYVVFVFKEHFGYHRAKCEHLMMQVHIEGRAVVSTDTRETAESHVQAMHSYGLQAILEPATAGED